MLATLSFGSCSRFGHSPSELLFYRADGTTRHQIDAPRKVYRYSIVPGGVYSGEELERARRVDPVVTAHYADFGTQVEADTLDKDMFVYISYRKENHVYWSAQKHKVPKGEKVLTDGKHMARTRCGNRLSLTPQKPIAKVEPPELNHLEDGPLLASLPTPPLFLPAAFPNLVPGTTGAGPGTGPAPVSSVVPGPSGSEVPVGGPVAVVPPPGAPIVGPVLPGVPTTPTTPVTPGCPPATTGQIEKSGVSAHAADPTDNCPTTPTTPVTPTAPTPEPGELGLVLLAGLGAGLVWRKRNPTA